METRSLSTQELSYITDEVKLILKEQTGDRRVSRLSSHVARLIYTDYNNSFVPKFYTKCFDFYEGLYDMGAVTKDSVKCVVDSGKYHVAYKPTQDLMMSYYEGNDISDQLLIMFADEVVCSEMVEDFMEMLE